MAKRVIVAFWLIAALFFLGKDIQAKDVVDNDNNQVIAYYFHGDFRCVTCRNLEQYAREAIENNFQKELAEGTLVFKAVNVEKKENDHFINDYQLYSKSLVVSLIKNGKQLRHKNLAKIWHLVRNKKKYLKYVEDEISAFLKEIQ